MPHYNPPYNKVKNGGTISYNNVTIGGSILATRETNVTAEVIVYLRGGTVENNTTSTSFDLYAMRDAQIIDQR